MAIRCEEDRRAEDAVRQAATDVLRDTILLPAARVGSDRGADLNVIEPRTAR